MRPLSLLFVLLLLAGCARRPGAYCPPGGAGAGRLASRPALPPPAAPLVALAAPAALGPPPSALIDRPRSTPRSHLQLTPPRRPPLAARLLGRRLARRVAAASAHAPANHALDGIGSAILIALLVLGGLALLIVLAATMPGTPVGIVALSILLGGALTLILLIAFA